MLRPMSIYALSSDRIYSIKVEFDAPRAGTQVYQTNITPMQWACNPVTGNEAQARLAEFPGLKAAPPEEPNEDGSMPEPAPDLFNYLCNYEYSVAFDFELAQSYVAPEEEEEEE